MSCIRLRLLLIKYKEKTLLIRSSVQYCQQCVHAKADRLGLNSSTQAHGSQHLNRYSQQYRSGLAMLPEDFHSNSKRKALHGYSYRKQGIQRAHRK